MSQNRFTFKNPLFKSVDSSLTFYPGNNFEEAYMILEMGDVFFCPRYPLIADDSPIAEQLTGVYTRYARHPSTYSDSDDMGDIEIVLSDGVLVLADTFGLLPISDNTILIQGGVFHGEVMEYDATTGIITWQHLIYKPAE